MNFSLNYRKDKQFIFILFLSLLAGCDNSCNDEVCPCPGIKIILRYNFSGADSTSFPREEVGNFRYTVVNKIDADTIARDQIFDGWLYSEEDYLSALIYESGELNDDEEMDLAYYIYNPDLNYIDSLYDIEYDYSVGECPDQENWCGSQDCKTFDLNSIYFSFNQNKIKYVDSSIITVNCN